MFFFNHPSVHVEPNKIDDHGYFRVVGILLAKVYNTKVMSPDMSYLSRIWIRDVFRGQKVEKNGCGLLSGLHEMCIFVVETYVSRLFGMDFLKLHFCRDAMGRNVEEKKS